MRRINVNIKILTMIIYVNFLNDNKTMETVTSYSYLEDNIHHNIILNFFTKKLGGMITLTWKKIEKKIDP